MVPVGITLSGGLDSTSIACILSEFLQKKNKPLYAFSSVLPVNHIGVERDERKFIELVNQKCPNIVQTYVEAPGAGPFQNVDKALSYDNDFRVTSITWTMQYLEAGFISSQDVVAPRIMQGVIATIIMTDLKKKGYVFD
jgi:hypothetical protein